MVRSWARDLVVSVAVAAFIILFVYQPVKVEGTSMLPGLEDQERIFINKFVYRLEPIERGRGTVPILSPIRSEHFLLGFASPVYTVLSCAMYFKSMVAVKIFIAGWTLIGVALKHW